MSPTRQLDKGSLGFKTALTLKVKHKTNDQQWKFNLTLWKDHFLCGPKSVLQEAPSKQNMKIGNK